ncbi:hypothetical protein Peur_059263 [Populus x canadensis]
MQRQPRKERERSWCRHEYHGSGKPCRSNRTRLLGALFLLMLCACFCDLWQLLCARSSPFFFVFLTCLIGSVFGFFIVSKLAGLMTFAFRTLAWTGRVDINSAKPALETQQVT